MLAEDRRQRKRWEADGSGARPLAEVRRWASMCFQFCGERGWRWVRTVLGLGNYSATLLWVSTNYVYLLKYVVNWMFYVACAK
jgi:hypothetical protein